MVLQLASLLLLLTVPPTQASVLPLTDDPSADEGLLCYWGCMAACIVAGKRQDQCDAVCTELCFSITTPPEGPTCEPEEEPIACLED